MNKKILLVDDDPEIIETVKIRLEALGYNTVSATDGQEGLIRVEQDKPDLIILDAMMPKMDGVEFSERLKKNLEYKKIPIILLSGLVYMEGRPGDQEIADVYVSKPFTTEELTNKINELLSKT